MQVSMKQHLVGCINRDIECIDFAIEHSLSVSLIAFYTRQILEGTLNLVLYIHADSEDSPYERDLYRLFKMVKDIPDEIRKKFKSLVQWNKRVRYDYKYILSLKFDDVCTVYQNVKTYALQVCENVK